MNLFRRRPKPQPVTATPVPPLEPERARFTFIGRTLFGNYRFQPENDAARSMAFPFAHWTMPREYFWTGDTTE